MTNLLEFVSRVKFKIKSRLFGKRAFFTLFSPFMPLLVKVFSHVAETGRGSDLCLKQGFLPMRVHYYSPIPDLADLEKRKVWDRESELAGLDFNPEKQVHFLRILGEKYGQECNWPDKPTGNPLEFYTENNSFSFGCAASLYSVLRYFKPKNVFEIGSGNSSLVFSSALTRNMAEGLSSNYSIIDPYPAFFANEELPGVTRVIKERVELLDSSLFEELGNNDVLFIDSGHTVRTGGDVNFLFLDVLPKLAPGVIVHVHDIGLPFEYPSVYFTNPSFRMFWTEAYLLQAFLCFNSEFEIMLAMNYLMTRGKDEFVDAFPYYDPERHLAVSGSFWFRRVPNQS